MSEEPGIPQEASAKRSRVRLEREGNEPGWQGMRRCYRRGEVVD